MPDNMASLSFWKNEMTTSRTVYQEGLSGDEDSQTLATYSEPNLALLNVRGGHIKTGTVIGGTGGAASTKDTSAIYQPFVDSVVAENMFVKLQHDVRRRIDYHAYDVQAYLVYVYHVYAAYVAAKEFVNLLDITQLGTLVEIPESLRALGPHFFGTATEQTEFNADIMDNREWLRLIELEFASMAIPPGFMANAKWVHSLRRTHSLPNAPVVGYGVALNRAIDDASDKDRDYGSPPLLILDDLRKLKANTVALKISSDLKAAFPSFAFVAHSPNAPSVDPAWHDLWKNNGVIYDQQDADASQTDSVVPNYKNASENKRYVLPYDFVTTPDMRLAGNLCFGAGDQAAEIRAMHTCNVLTLALSGSEGINAGNVQVQLHVAMPTASDLDAVAPGINRNDVSNAHMDDIEDVVFWSAALRGIDPGWIASAQYTFLTANLASKTPERAGFARIHPPVGERWYVDAVALRTDALRYWLGAAGL